MKIFGGWIPALRFQRYEVTQDGFPIVEGYESCELDAGGPSGYETDALIFEWDLFGFLFILFTTNIRECKDKNEAVDS